MAKSLAASMQKTMKEELNNKIDNRFSVVEEVLIKQDIAPIQSEPDQQLSVPPTKTKLKVKNIKLTDNDNARIDKIMDKFMDLKTMVNRTDIIRMGLVILNEVPIELLKDTYSKIDKLK